MKCYTHPSYSYVTVVEIPKTEIKKIDFATCNEPRETLSSYYNRQTEKPAVLSNGGFFNMSTGDPVMNNIDEGATKASNDTYIYGMGVLASDHSTLIQAKYTSYKFTDFLTGYPILLYNTGAPLTSWDYASEINYNAARTMLGYNDSTIFLVTVSRATPYTTYPGMAFTAMSKLMYDLGCKYAINLDGGGSSRLMVNGEVKNTPSEDRAVDNVVAIYLNSTATTTTDTSITGTTTTTTTTDATTPATSDYNLGTDYDEYTVVKGDSWWSIATKFLGNGAKYTTIMDYNNIAHTNTTLTVGTVIKIPLDYYKHTVTTGDIWNGIGLRYSISDSVSNYNGKTDSSAIKVGDIIKIPKSTT